MSVRILVLRALAGLGDMLCVVPALRALRAGRPGATITLVGAPGARWFRGVYPELLDEWIELRGWPGIPEAPGDADEALVQLQQLRARRFDLALQLHGDGTVTNVWTALTGAAACGVMASAAAWVPPGASVAYVEPSTDEVGRQLAVLERVGIHADDRRLHFPIDDAAVAEAARLAPPGPYLVLHPGASVAARRWPTAGFAAVAAAAAERGVRSVITGVAGEEQLGRDIARLSGLEPIDLVARTSLRASAAVVAGAVGVVTNDTGMSHLAAAVGTPAVVVFHVPDHRRWLPVTPGHVPVPAAAPVERTVAVTMAHLDDWLTGDERRERAGAQTGTDRSSSIGSTGGDHVSWTRSAPMPRSPVPTRRAKDRWPPR